MYRQELSFQDKMMGNTDLSARQATMIKQTYLLLSLSVVAAMVGASIGSGTPAIRNFFMGPIGWIAAMVLLNVIPSIAMATRHMGILGFGMLLADGFVAGLVLGPIIYIAERFAPGTLGTALIITGIIFASVTGYVLTSKRTFSAPRGLMTGMFFALIGLVVANLILEVSFLSLLISAVIGVFGLMTLIYATSDILNNPEADSAIPGALMLFSGLFMVFQSVLHLLMAFGGDD